MRAGSNPFLTALTPRAVSAAALYDDWLVAETEATLSLAVWRDAPHGHKAAAYRLYASALDAEAAAAAQLAQLLRRRRAR
jgi:hypothetical protein